MLRHSSCSLIRVSPLNLFTAGGKRNASGWKKRTLRQFEIENITYQYAGRNLKRSDRIYVWGCASTGALGVNTLLKPKRHQRLRQQQLTPLLLSFMNEKRLKVKQVACGYGYTVYICQDKITQQYFLYGTGLNTDSQLGYHKQSHQTNKFLEFLMEPRQVNLPLLHPQSTTLTGVACGRAHTVISTDKEGIFTLGNNSYGQCGRPIIEQEIYRGSQTVHRIDFQEPVKQIVCGQDHTLILSQSGTVYSCGLATDGQTGLGHYNSIGQLTKVKGDIADEVIVHLSSKADTILAISEKGEVFGWGNTEYNQLSVVNDNAMQLNSPCHLPFKSVGHVTMAAAAGSMCSVLNDDGQMFVWGYGILGQGPNVEMSATPRPIPRSLFGETEYDPDVKVVSIDSGLFHFAALNGPSSCGG